MAVDWEHTVSTIRAELPRIALLALFYEWLGATVLDSGGTVG